MPALPGSPSSLISAPRQAASHPWHFQLLPRLQWISKPLDWSESLLARGYWVEWLFNPQAALRHSPGAASLSIYFPSFRSQGTGLLLSCWLLWKAMCCKYNILLSWDETVAQFRISKGRIPSLLVCSGMGVCHTEICPTSELPQQLSMLCSMHLYWCWFTHAWLNIKMLSINCLTLHNCKLIVWTVFHLLNRYIKLFCPFLFYFSDIFSFTAIFNYLLLI